ncbi:hypothetical protein ACFWPV_09925 [Streptomyces uncialis]|uniref:hypothetical protein n=1 Tax=Streptomyces uncialis TaxID=1048205 RepID=UPI0036634848
MTAATLLREQHTAHRTEPLDPSGKRNIARLIRAVISLDNRVDAAVPLGVGFDVVVTGGGDGAGAVLADLDQVQLGRSGPLIIDPDNGWHYWLVPPGTAGRWQHDYGVCVGRPRLLTVPPAHRDRPDGTGRPYWARPCGGDRLVPPSALRRSLRQFQPLPAPHRALTSHLNAPRNPPSRTRPYTHGAWLPDLPSREERR